MIDCRGLACPQPVLRAKEFVESENAESVEVLVDNQAASQNVSRFLESQGFDASVEARGDDFLVSGSRNPQKEAAPTPPETFTCATEGRRILVFVGSDRIGRGDDELGSGLMQNFLATLKEMGSDLWRLIFVNSGVKLCIQGAKPLDSLKELEAAGVSILVCGTCLNFFDLLEQKEVGETTNMLDVVTSLQLADKVISV
ncbi:MAG: sulfurtransferase-like selenium metabolism protein YedF [Desulfarculaceae bacterium]|jgi:selenium metabolism protein YedF